MQRLDDERALSAVPRARGAYRLYRGGHIILIGAALDLHRLLEDLRRGAEGECARSATAFDFQVDEDPVGLQRRWLAQFARDNGAALPECNARRRNGDGNKPPR